MAMCLLCLSTLSGMKLTHSSAISSEIVCQDLQKKKKKKSWLDTELMINAHKRFVMLDGMTPFCLSQTTIQAHTHKHTHSHAPIGTYEAHMCSCGLCVNPRCKGKHREGEMDGMQCRFLFAVGESFAICKRGDHTGDGSTCLLYRKILQPTPL